MAKTALDNERTKKVRTSVSLEPGDYEEIEHIAKQKKVSVAWVVREAIEEYLDAREPLLRRRRRGIASGERQQ